MGEFWLGFITFPLLALVVAVTVIGGVWLFERGTWGFECPCGRKWGASRPDYANQRKQFDRLIRLQCKAHTRSCPVAAAHAVWWRQVRHVQQHGGVLPPRPSTNRDDYPLS